MINLVVIKCSMKLYSDHNLGIGLLANTFFIPLLINTPDSFPFPVFMSHCLAIFK